MRRRLQPSLRPSGVDLRSAVMAGAYLEPGSAPVRDARLRERYPRSPWALALDGRSPGDFPASAASEATLRVAWKDVALQFADSLTRLRTPVVPGANTRTVRPVKKPAAKSPAQGAIP